ncbi:MAG: ferredoxin--NADP reductase [Bacteroidota bacterium]
MAFSFFKKNKEEKKETSSSSLQHYYDLAVSEIVHETKDAISITFKQPDAKIEYKSGQFLTLIVKVEGKEVRRAYSLCSSPFTDSDLTVAVKRVDNGLMSNWLPDNLKVGDTMRIMEPMGVFTTEYNASNKRHLILFAGGSGITPMMSIIKSTLSQEPDSIISLIYANRNIESIIFKDQLDQLATDYEGRLHLIHILDDAPMNWQGHSGLLNHDMLVQILERVPNWEDTTYLMCGPEGMMKNVENLLSEQSIDKSKIFKESFVAGTIDKAENAGSSAVDGAKQVTVVYDGEEHKFAVEPDTTILETALDMGIDLPYSCQSGLCTACRGKCLSGKVKLDEEEGLSEAELEEGYILTCVGHPLTDDVVIEIG